MIPVPDGRARWRLAPGSRARDWARPSLPRNVVLNWTSTGITILSTLIVTPIVVKALDKELYGIWSFLNGLLTYTDLLYLGIGAALVKYAAEYLARCDDDGLNRLCSVVLSIYVVVGVVALGIAALIAPVVPSLFARSLAPATALAAQYTCVLLGFRLLSLFVCAAFSGALIAADRTDVARLVTIAFTLLRLAFIPAVVHAASPLVALAALVCVLALAEALVTAWLASRFVRGLRPRLVLPRAAELRVLYGFGLQSFCVLMAVKLISYTDQTVIGLTLGAAAVALYVLPLQLIEYGRLVVGGMVAVLLPRLTVLQMNGDAAGLARTYLQVSRLSCALAAFINVELIVLGPAFLSRWVGPEFGEHAHFVLLCLGVSSVVHAISSQAALPFYQATDRLVFPGVVLLLEGAANVALSLVLIPRMGLDGVALGTLIPSLCISFLILPRYMSRALHVRLPQLVTDALLPACGVAAVTFVALAGLEYPFAGHSYLMLTVRAGVSTAIVLAAAVGAMRLDRRRAPAPAAADAVPATAVAGPEAGR